MNQPANPTHQRTYHGDITPETMAATLMAEFNQGHLMARQLGAGREVLVQIASRPGAGTGGKTCIAVPLQKVEDGVNVTIGQQDMLGVAASLGQTALATLFNPWSLIGRLDGLAQDVTALNLADKIWNVLEQFARATRATKAISARLQSVTCPYCSTVNKWGAPQCVTCGAPLGEAQPIACLQCGNILPPKSNFCLNCGTAVKK